MFSAPLTVPFVRWWTGRSSFPTMLLLWVFSTMFWRLRLTRSSATRVTLRFTSTHMFLFTAAVLSWWSTSWPALFPTMLTMSFPLFWWRAVTSFSPMMLFSAAFVMCWNRAWALANRRRMTPMSPFLFAMFLAWMALFYLLILLLVFLFLFFSTLRSNLVSVQHLSVWMAAGSASSRLPTLFSFSTKMPSLFFICIRFFTTWFLFRFTLAVWTITSQSYKSNEILFSLKCKG